MDSLILRTFVVHDLFATVHILFTTLCKNLRRILFFECKQQFLIEIKQQFFLFPVLNDDHRVVWNVILIGGIIKLRQSDPAPVFAVLCHSHTRHRDDDVHALHRGGHVRSHIHHRDDGDVRVLHRGGRVRSHTRHRDGDVHALHRGGRVRSHTRHRDDGDVRVPLQPLLLPLQAFQVQD